MERPVAQDGKSLVVPERSPREINADIAHEASTQEFMQKSGDLTVCNDKMATLIGVCKGLTTAGLDLSDVSAVLHEIDRKTPDVGGIGRKQTMQVLTTPKYPLPGIGMGGPFVDERNFLQRFIDWARGGGAKA